MGKGNKSGGKNSNTKNPDITRDSGLLSFSNEKKLHMTFGEICFNTTTYWIWYKMNEITHIFEKQQSKSRSTVNPLRLKKQTHHKYSVLSAQYTSPLEKLHPYLSIYMYICRYITALEVSSCSSSWTKLFRGSDKDFLNVCTAGWHSKLPVNCCTV